MSECLALVGHLHRSREDTDPKEFQGVGRRRKIKHSRHEQNVENRLHRRRENGSCDGERNRFSRSCCDFLLRFFAQIVDFEAKSYFDGG